ncbi:MAG: biotin transporter BioY [Anaerocolumna aminovalerica]|uniref:biotin transporter BioY n=1 Tax=Anaerocolumna aminovalerica TaxID=1527 RepID=UPI00280AD6E2|nr:biotin transporter BioY [Anaerocolumna aminovalerica]MDU6263082.1 biotin transporter BioY [Anaerocolumna aminovalerica]
MEHIEKKNRGLTNNKKSSNRNRNVTLNLVMTGMFSALLIVLSQLSIPSPTGVPITLQTFAVAITGVILGWKFGLVSTLIYILLGIAGLPVFANFKAGLQAIVGPTGGFIYGFILMVILCGIGAKRKNILVGILIGIIGLFGCHLLGINHYAFLSNISFWKSALLVSIPYFIKDVISIVLAFVIGRQVKKSIENYRL